MSATRFLRTTTVLCALSAAVGFFSAISDASAQARQEPLFAVLHGNNECNSVAPPNGPVCKKGEATAYGSATVLIVANNRICFAILVNGMTAGAATQAHIHRGRPGDNGHVVVGLAAPIAPNNSNPGTSSGCVGVAAATLAPIINNPTEFYVNVHGVGVFGGGSLRGQLF